MGPPSALHPLDERVFEQSCCPLDDPDVTLSPRGGEDLKKIVVCPRLSMR